MLLHYKALWALRSLPLTKEKVPVRVLDNKVGKHSLKAQNESSTLENGFIAFKISHLIDL